MFTIKAKIIDDTIASNVKSIMQAWKSSERYNITINKEQNCFELQPCGNTWHYHLGHLLAFAGFKMSEAD